MPAYYLMIYLSKAPDFQFADIEAMTYPSLPIQFITCPNPPNSKSLILNIEQSHCRISNPPNVQKHFIAKSLIMKQKQEDIAISNPSHIQVIPWNNHNLALYI